MDRRLFERKQQTNAIYGFSAKLKIVFCSERRKRKTKTLLAGKFYRFCGNTKEEKTSMIKRVWNNKIL